ncbi:uncharacterized protein LOC127438245 isoform X9 [Myxocyprinus asiaticus]|uniref:uncharacterized protein LOC127438245 isoform X7 n=1 Tax=Myxocyprinus asiaticus TaxID=70543 RepID=UPI0022220C91|nr:uncharacterized protein LOC127438245 isoform X7 [Myxocyprinus asiaticus]XP_051549646.1 uncharacterized protein LOC127438245 isoform X8 [Myxocyprinus asiaticus]XP_051549647.1 uncharacterized protein LOC127438245 isoform X9 [Myxocyprinus asiaticus]
MKVPIKHLSFAFLVLSFTFVQAQGIVTVGGNDPGKVCVFPFSYDKQMYFECTTINNNHIPWCATTSDYPKDNKWGNCPFTGPPTTGGNSNGAPCKFPFKYNNKDYYYCTTDNEESKKLWCATVSNYAQDAKWGYCPTSGIVTVGGNDPGKECVFPFSFDKQMYFECTTISNNHIPWCATTSDYAKDNKWGNCPFTGIVTVGGNDPGKVCVFPFSYDKQMYFECTTINNNHIPWCATTSDYPKDNKWGNCPFTGPPTTGGNSNGAPCKFPFKYNDKDYYNCTTDNEESKKLWCATVSNYAQDAKWGYCPTSGIVTVGGNDPGKECVFPFSYDKQMYFECTTINNNNIPWCATTSDFAKDNKWGNCPFTGIVTVGGNDPGKVCVFPFSYDKQMYFECTTINNNHIPWCATTSDYPKDNKWGNCPFTGPPTTGGNSNGAPCKFPFKYNNKDYYYCTTDNEESKKLWCATVSNYAQDAKWGYCPTSGIVTVGGNDPGKECVFPFSFDKQMYFECTTISNNHIPWCATTSDYAKDNKWGNCPFTGIVTVGGNDPGKVCVFPFSYDKQMYFECTTINNNHIPWCATTSDYPKDNKWGNCPFTGPPTTGGNSNGAPCKFPFKYNDKDYYYCTTDNEESKKLWCATVSNYAQDAKWGYCPTSGIVTVGGNDPGKECVFPFSYDKQMYFECTTINNNHIPWCATTSDFAKDNKWGNCPFTGIVTVGGNDPGKVCVFPFSYDKQMYYECTTINNNHIPWCATTSDYPKDNKWGNCPFTGPPTTGGNSNGAPCKFPFKYNNKDYYYCTTDNEESKKLWCATVSNYAQDAKWGYCPTSGIVTVGGNDPGKECVFPFSFDKQMYFECTTISNNHIPWCSTTSDYAKDNKWGNCPFTEVTCQIKSTSYGMERIEPEGKTIFRAGETVKITCSERYWIFGIKETTKSFTCQIDGQWDYEPTCVDIRCEVPHDRRVSDPEIYFRGDLKLDAEIYYYCNSGYIKMRRLAKCTRDGWKPDPLCADITCEAPTIPNAEIEGDQRQNYEVSSRIVYKCHSGFKPEQRVQITCNSQGQWTGIQHCTEDVRCDIPPKVENAVMTSDPQKFYPEGSSVTYKCRNLFTIRGPSRVFCHNASWGETPKCEVFCLKPLRTVNNAMLVDENQDKREYSYGDTVHYKCVEEFESRETTAKCDVQTWIYPKCIKKSQCSKPTKYMTFVTLLNEKNVYNNFENLSYKCKSPYDKIPEGTWTCEDKEWYGAFVCTSEICPPPPHLEHGDYTVVRKNGEVITEVYYTCKRDYVLDKQQQYYKCQNGRWETPPKCLEPCEITSDIIEKYSVQPPQYKVYVKHGDTYWLYCKSGWNIGDRWRSEYLEVSCSNGEFKSDKTCNKKNRLKRRFGVETLRSEDPSDVSRA